ncbi:DUF4333 domain-containing protein [Propionibacteriaceae bacterium Y2011]|uniref:DUF4333 domain-containing protein n=1 Tax=Microlunatus sp. Y2014 TaxID=3418488 RepID=UPI003B4A2BB5
MRKILVTVAVAMVALVSLTGCFGPPTVSQADVEEQISTQLEKQVGTKPDQVTCPGDLTGEVGTTMTCTLTHEGQSLDVNVEVTEVEGSTVRFNIKVAEA